MALKATTNIADRRRAMFPSQAKLAATLSRRKTMVLTTFKKDGTPVGTPVSVAVDGEKIYFRTYTKTWKVKRLRRNPLVEVTPSTFRGKPRGPTLPARVRLLEGDEADWREMSCSVALARDALARRHPILQRMLVPALHELLRYTTIHYEITSCRGQPASIARARPVERNGMAVWCRQTREDLRLSGQGAMDDRPVAIA